MYVLNPTTLTTKPGSAIQPRSFFHTPNAVKVINALFALNPEQVYFPPGEYFISYGRKRHLQVQLTHGLLKRSSFSRPYLMRIEVIEPQEFYKGSLSRVHDTLGVLKHEDHYRFKAKPRIFKHYNLFPQHGIGVNQVYANACKNQHSSDLHAKYPVKDSGVYLVMKRISGQDLFSLINDGILEIMTDTQKLLLIYKLLVALKAFHDAGFIHRDLKPENIFVNLKTEKITFIDLDTIQDITQPTLDFAGTPRFCAPEILANASAPRYSIASDVFSMGLICAQICGDWYYEESNEITAYSKIVELHRNRIWVDLFNNRPQGSFEKDLIFLLDGLAAFKPHERWDLASAIAYVESLIREYAVPKELAVENRLEVYWNRLAP